MKVKKILLMVLSLVLTAVLAVAGTLAYLTATDSDINIMTVGNVKIEQHEYERVVDENGDYTTIDVDGITSYELKDFTQAKPLLPFVGDVMGGYDSTTVRLAQLGHNSRGGMDVFPAANVQDKFVVVENTGKTDAYVRTIVAFEVGALSYEEWAEIIGYSFHFTWENNILEGTVEIDGNNYILVEFIYNGYQDADISQHPGGVLTPGDYTYNSLAQIYMDKTATNEDVEAIDGNKSGTYDILVVSQAVQAAGFDSAEQALDEAFYDVTAQQHPWIDGVDIPVTVNDADALTAAFAAGDDIILTDSVKKSPDTAAPYGNSTAYIQNGNTIDGAGNTLDMGEPESGDNYGIMTSGGTIKNITIQNSDRAIMIMSPTEDIIVENVVIKDNVMYPFNTGEKGANGVKLIVNDSVLGGWISFEYLESASFTNCKFVQGTYYNDIYGRVLRPYVNTTVKNCAFDNAFNLDLSKLNAGCVVTIENCTVNGQALKADVCTINPSDYDNCTFSIDLPAGRSLEDCVIFK